MDDLLAMKTEDVELVVRAISFQDFPPISPAAKSKNISLCGEIMKLGTLIGDPSRIIFRLRPNSETPHGGRHLELQYGCHVCHTFAYNCENKTKV